MNGMALCAGIGGLELGLRIVLPKYRTVCYVEREAYAASTLVARMEDETLDHAPIWDDLKTFDGRPWRKKVDCVTSGYPCQPFSLAGKRLGEADPRHLWPHVARIVGEVRPSICFFENVGQHLRCGFERVRDDLFAMGYVVKAGLFSAEEIGAPHRRERFFILAYDDGKPLWRGASADGGTEMAHAAGDRRPNHFGPTWTGDESFDRDSREAVGHTENNGRTQSGDAWRWVGGPENPGVGLADACRTRLQDAEPEREPGRPTPELREFPLFPPGPADLDAWAEVLSIDPALEPAICGLADGISSRVDELRAYGNAVVPLVAAYAFCTLADAAGII